MGATQDKSRGAVNQAVGKTKRAVGNMMGDQRLKDQGAKQQVKGDAQTALGNTKNAVGDTLKRAGAAMKKAGK